jgi:hypothetical protein
MAKSANLDVGDLGKATVHGLDKPMLRVPLILAVAALWPVCASAASGLAPVGPPTQVGGIVVPGGPPPKVAASYPADGTSVPAGTLVLKITFDQPMTPDSWSYSPVLGAGFPNCLERPRLLGDQHTFVLLCAVNAHQDYAIQINVPKDFAAETGRTAKPAVLRFATDDVGPRDIHDALVLAGLTDHDDPVMTWKDPGAGVSRSGPHDAETAADAPAPVPTSGPNQRVR